MYQGYVSSVTFAEARSLCQNLGGYLVSINNGNENQFVLDFSIGFSSSNYIWIGLEGDQCDADNEDDLCEVWNWEDGTSTDSNGYANWAPGYPDYDKYGKIYGFMRIRAEDVGMWRNSADIGGAAVRHFTCEFEACSSDPCLNGATCSIDSCVSGNSCDDQTQNNGLYECACAPGWEGANCEVDIDECASDPCVFGTCVNGVDEFICNCDLGYTGVQCESEIDECESDPCQNGGRCEDLVGAFECDCTDTGYEGATCQTEIDECLSDPCQNGGTCINLINEFECNCTDTGYEGTVCEVEVDECLSEPCQNGGVCANLINEFQCNCTDTGFEGATCETEIDECLSDPCQNGGTCINLINEFECDCTGTGFYGELCELDQCSANWQPPPLLVIAS